MTRCCMIVIGATGDGKSSLCNFTLGKNAFQVSANTESETKETLGSNGINGAENVYVIDTPGLHDSEGTDKEHIKQMVQFIRQHKELQSVIIVFNFHQPRLDGCIKTMLKIFCNMFPIDDFWEHVAFVFTHCIEPKKASQKKKDEELKIQKTKEYAEKIGEIIKECGGTAPKKFPTYFVDSDMDEPDPKSVEEVNALIGWSSGLQPLDVARVKEVDTRVWREETETSTKITGSHIEKNIEYTEIDLIRRKKQFHYDGSISYTDWEVYDHDKKAKVLPRKVVSEYDEGDTETKQIDENGRASIVFTPRKRKVKVYNDGTKEEGEWEKDVTKPEQKIPVDDGKSKVLETKELTKKELHLDGSIYVLAQTIIIKSDGTKEVISDWNIKDIIPAKNEKKYIRTDKVITTVREKATINEKVKNEYSVGEKIGTVCTLGIYTFFHDDFKNADVEATYEVKYEIWYDIYEDKNGNQEKKEAGKYEQSRRRVWD